MHVSVIGFPKRGWGRGEIEHLNLGGGNEAGILINRYLTTQFSRKIWGLCWERKGRLETSCLSSRSIELMADENEIRVRGKY